MKRKISVALFLLVALSLSAQKHEWLGVSLNGDLHTRNSLNAGSGVFYENHFSKHFSFEAGLNLRSKNSEFYLSNPFAGFMNVYFDVREDYLSVPVLFKFYSKIATVSTGLNVDYFVCWRQLAGDAYSEIISYTLGKRLYMGWNIKVGKTIDIAPKLALEPEVYFNPILGGYGSYYGASLKLKYKLK